MSYFWVKQAFLARRPLQWCARGVPFSLMFQMIYYARGTPKTSMKSQRNLAPSIYGALMASFNLSPSNYGVPFSPKPLPTQLLAVSFPVLQTPRAPLFLFQIKINHGIVEPLHLSPSRGPSLFVQNKNQPWHRSTSRPLPIQLRGTIMIPTKTSPHSTTVHPAESLFWHRETRLIQSGPANFRSCKFCNASPCTRTCYVMSLRLDFLPRIQLLVTQQILRSGTVKRVSFSHDLLISGLGPFATRHRAPGRAT